MLAYFSCIIKFLKLLQQHMLGFILTKYLMKRTAPDNPSEWGLYCKRLMKHLQKNESCHLYFNHLVIMIVVATQVLWICSELLLELEERSKDFHKWWRNSYQLNAHRQNSHGG